MFTNNKRIIRLILAATFMNLGLFSLAYFLNLPLWLDTTGTLYISCILGAPVGFLVAIINNIVEALFFYGGQSIFYYFVSLLTAYVAGKLYKKYIDTRVKKWFMITIFLILLEGCSAVIITFCVDAGYPSNYWSMMIYQKVINHGYDRIIATIISVLAIKIPDIIITTFIVIFATYLTPKKYRTKDFIILRGAEERT